MLERRQQLRHTGAQMASQQHPGSRFGSTDSFLESGSWRARMGRPVANEAFLGALLQYGSFSHYDFFLPDAAALSRWQQQLERLLPEAALRQRVHAKLQIDLTAALQQAPYAVFHQGDFTYFTPHLAALRQACTALYGSAAFCLSGVTHSLDNLQTRFLQLSLANLQPYDGIVCTSAAAVQVVQHKWAEVHTLLQQRGVVEARLPALETTCIPLGVADKAFLPAAPAPRQQMRQQARQALHLPADACVLLALGRLSLRSKNDWAPIFELWARLQTEQALPNTQLLLAGGCSAESLELLQTLQQHYGLRATVRLLPNVSVTAKAQLLAAADVALALVDNLQETFGLSVVEAMAAGLPVLAANYSGYRDTVLHAQTGWLIPTCTSPQVPTCMQASLGVLDPSICSLLAAQMTALDLDALAAALRALCNHSELRQQLGQQARQHAEKFRWPQVIAAYEAFWRHLAQRIPPPQTPRAPLHSAHLLGGVALQAYTGHVSHLLDAADQLILTEHGAHLLQDPNCVTRYADVLPLLLPAVEAALLNAAQQPQSVAALRQIAVQALPPRQRRSLQTGDIDFQMIWLLKHGALKFLGDAAQKGYD